jgi:hypothetical protein
LPSLGNVFIYLNFKLHQEDIAKTLCIQREMKENKCNGHCFLANQLKKEAEKEKKETENLKEKKELVYVQTLSENSVTFLKKTDKNRALIWLTCDKPNSISLAIFRPPLVQL